MKKTLNELENLSVDSVGLSAKDRIKKLQEEETKTVKGRFRCFETPGGSLRVQIKKYKDVPMFDKTMLDNEVYEVPLYVARHLNGVDHLAKNINGKINSCAYPVHSHLMIGNEWSPSKLDDMGQPVPQIGVAKWVRRYGFESLQFDVLGEI